MLVKFSGQKFRLLKMADVNAHVSKLLLPHINNLLSSRHYPKTICPSEVARAIRPDDLEDLGIVDWRDLMPDIRQILWSMRERGEVQILQKGIILEDIQLHDIKGPIRARRIQDPDATANAD